MGNAELTVVAKGDNLLVLPSKAAQVQVVVSYDDQFRFVLGKFESQDSGIEEKQILTPDIYEFVAN